MTSKIQCKEIIQKKWLDNQRGMKGASKTTIKNRREKLFIDYNRRKLEINL